MGLSQLNQTSLGTLRGLFSSLEIPAIDSIAGTYRGSFAGPRWTRVAIRPALWLTGLGRWWGKELSSQGTAINLIRKGGNLTTRFPMKIIRGKSFIDGRDGLLLYYLPNHPILWLLVEDEIRRLDQNTLLGMTHSRIPILGRLVLPFILKKQTS
jgi:hypothetical protein